MNLAPQGMTIMVFRGNWGENPRVGRNRRSEGLASVGTDPLRMVAGRLKIHRLGGPLRGFVQPDVKADSKAGDMKPLRRSRLSFFDFVRSLTLLR